MNIWPNWVDLLVLTFVFITGYKGFHRGLLAGLINLVAVVLVTALIVNGASTLTHAIQPWLQIDAVAAACAIFWLVFLAGILVTQRVLHLVSQWITWERTNLITQALGLTLGALRGLWWSGFIVIALASSGIPYLQGSVEDRSVVGPRLLSAATHALEQVANVMPGWEARGASLIPPLR